MVLRLSRGRPGSGSAALAPTRPAASSGSGWASARGAVLFEACSDIVGGFPGYDGCGAALEGAQIAVTDRFLLVEEGRPHGFALPIRSIEGTALVGQPGRDDADLRIVHRDGGTRRVFTLRFRPGRLALRGGRRSERAQDAIAAAGHDLLAADPPDEPAYAFSWEQARDYENENVLWSGRVSAPVRVGSESTPSDLWLSTRSVIWGNADGVGLNRVAIHEVADLISARLRDRHGAPAIYLGLGGGGRCRFETPIVFDRHTPPDRNFRDRGALLVALRSRGIPDGAAPAPWQPWRDAADARDAEPDFDGGEPDWSSAEESEPAHAAIEPVPRAIWSAGRPRPGAADPSSSMEPERGTLPRRRGFGGRLLRLQEIAISGTPTLREGSDGPEPSLPENGVSHGEPDPFDSTLLSGAEAVAVDDLMLAEWSAVPDDDPTVEIDDVQIGETRILDIEASDQAPATSEDGLLSSTVARESDQFRRRSDVAPADAERVASADGDDPGDGHPQEVAVAEEPDADGTPSGIRAEDAASGIVQPWPRSTACETAAVAALGEAIRAVDARISGGRPGGWSEPLPSSLEQSAAIAELRGPSGRGLPPTGDAGGREERILALSDAAHRLRSLCELQAMGHVTSAELERRRAKIVGGLAEVLARRADG